ncbi:MAG: hypothetical protein M3024_05095 [Candidatus Dormibacteraeota bacterium]|nr:hypothetical protein [Candidatus Dormibacteraeota bacterium]MDQ6900452.1 hypothetical protein [Candidatus Dormibacteraeota bacterium]
MVNGATGLLIIRAYLEAGSVRPLRAEIRLTSDVSSGFQRTRTLADAEAVIEAVSVWLDNFVKDLPETSERHAGVTQR